MTEDDLEIVGVAEIVLATIMCFYMISGLMPDTYGVYQWLKDNGQLAPWFSGCATTLGVCAALWNGTRQVAAAVAKDAKDEQRSMHQTARSERAMAEAACGIVNLARLGPQVVKSRLEKDDWKSKISAVRFALTEPLSVATSALSRFPAHEISRPSALRYWYRVEIGHSYLVTSLNELDDLIKSDELTEEDEHDRRDSLLEDCERLFKASDKFAKALDVDTEEAWDKIVDAE